MFQAQPPPPPTPEIVRTESAYLQAGRRDMPLTLSRAPAARGKAPATERALLRYRLYVRTDVEARQPPLGEGPVIVKITCDWTVSTFLQREPCFESITGRLACGESYTVRMEERQTGSETRVAEPSACGLAHPAAAAAEARLRAVLAEKADTLFDDDLARRYTPELAKAGITVTPREK